MLAIDSSVIVRAFNRASVDYSTSLNFFEKARRAQIELITFPQNLAEFWAVATRPIESNALGHCVQDTARRVALIERFGQVLSEHPQAYQRWKQLVTAHEVRGKTTHDARIVAQMMAHGIGSLVTFNIGDFSRYTDIATMTPEQALREMVG